MFNLKILTPLHIGTSEEKDYVNKVDYIIRDDYAYIIDFSRFIKEQNYSIDQISNALTTNNGISPFFENENTLENYSTKRIFVGNTSPSTIKAQIKSGFGNPLLPGSSIKGALRSVILNRALFSIYSYNELKVYAEKNRRNRRANPERDLLNLSISNDPFRLITIPDIHFSDIDYSPTKIFNLYKDHGEWTGGWKHRFRGRGSTTYEFNPIDFVTFYEHIKPDIENQLAIDCNVNRRTIQHVGSRYIDTFGDLFINGKYERNLLELIKEYTATYLDRERNFFYTFYNDETDDYILPTIDQLIEINKQRDTAVLRIGAGSGFHSMIGDWKYKWWDREFNRDGSHYAAIDRNDYRLERRRNNRDVLLKSRKLSFKMVDNHNYSFEPMGFVSISL